MRRSTATPFLALPLAALAIAGCGSSHTVGQAPGRTGTLAAATASGSSTPASAESTDGVGPRRHPSRGSGPVLSDTGILDPSRYAEGARHGQGPYRSSTHHLVPTSPAPGTRHGHGTYVGPAHDGRNRCGYQFVGPGLEQAAAFVTHSASCATAKALARAARGRMRNGQRYATRGFACAVTIDGRHGLAHYRCTRRDAVVRFVVR